MESLEFKVGNAKRVYFPRLIKSLIPKNMVFFPQFFCTLPDLPTSITLDHYSFLVVN